MTELNKADYISLSEAAKLSPYSQEYLSLRARQGKLRAIKQGRNWVTTLGWLDDYQAEVEESLDALRNTTTITPAKPISIDPVRLATLDDFEWQRSPGGEVSAGEVVGEIADEDRRTVRPSKFAWDFEEPASVQPNHKLVLDDLKRRAAAREPEENAFINLEQPVYAELGQPTEAPEPKLSVHGDDWLGPLLRPALAVAIFVLLFTTIAIFDQPLLIHQNVAAGFGIALQKTGQGLIAAGQHRQEAQGRDLVNTTLDSPFIVRADESLPNQGRVAGVMTERPQSKDPGVWQSMWLGLKIVFGLDH